MSNKSFEESCLELETKLGYHFKNKKLLYEALSHPSLKQTNINAKDYEKLEILGDSVLGFVVTEMIFSSHHDFAEGQIAKIKSHLVSKEVISEIALRLGLSEHIIMAFSEEKTGGRQNVNNLENSMEALIAAIYLDSDFATIKEILNNLWVGYTKNIDLVDIDPKSYLQEIAHKKLQKIPKYNLLQKSGSSHDPVFHVEARVGNLKSTGKEGSIKKAEKQAAKSLINLIKSE